MLKNTTSTNVSNGKSTLKSFFGKPKQFVCPILLWSSFLSFFLSSFFSFFLSSFFLPFYPSLPLSSIFIYFSIYLNISLSLFRSLFLFKKSKRIDVIVNLVNRMTEWKDDSQDPFGSGFKTECHWRYAHIYLKYYFFLIHTVLYNL